MYPDPERHSVSLAGKIQRGHRFVACAVLKDGWCTVLFICFLADKATTMTMKGGNTEELYKLNGQADGRLLMAQSPPTPTS